jgi:hypothetical protein
VSAARAACAAGAAAAAAAVLLAACDAAPERRGDTADTMAPAAAAADTGTAPLDLASIGPAASEADLAARFGAGSLRRDSAHVGEGFYEPATWIHPDDSLRTVAVFWHDTTRRRAPERLRVSGDSTRWRVGPGITLGTDLATLERLNGAPFTLSGFGWDYGGTVGAWAGGALDSIVPQGGLLLRLAVPAGAAPERVAVAESLSGDRPFRSDDPRMRRANPEVREIHLFYHPAPADTTSPVTP